MRKDKTKNEKEVRRRNVSSLDIKGKGSGECGCRMVVSIEEGQRMRESRLDHMFCLCNNFL